VLLPGHVPIAFFGVETLNGEPRGSRAWYRGPFSKPATVEKSEPYIVFLPILNRRASGGGVLRDVPKRFHGEGAVSRPPPFGMDHSPPGCAPRD